MTIYRKCRLCTKKDGCQIKTDLGKALAGLGVTSVLHKCPEYEPPYKPGEPLFMRMYCGTPEYNEHYSEGIPEGLFPGHFIRQFGIKAMVYVPDGTMDTTSQVEFEARSNGYCKVSFGRLTPRPNGDNIETCEHCGVKKPNCLQDYCPAGKISDVSVA